MSVTEPTGTEVQQSETPDYPSVKVQVESPVRVQQLPAVMASMKLQVIPFDGKAYKILGRDPRRSRVFLRGLAGTTWLGTTEGQALHKQGFELSAQVNIEMFHGDEVWGLADTVDVRISVLSELWTE